MHEHLTKKCLLVLGFGVFQILYGSTWRLHRRPLLSFLVLSQRASEHRHPTSMSESELRYPHSTRRTPVTVTTENLQSSLETEYSPLSPISLMLVPLSQSLRLKFWLYIEYISSSSSSGSYKREITRHRTLHCLWSWVVRTTFSIILTSFSAT